MDVRNFLDRFREPDPRFSPAPIWWWSGEKLEIERLRTQLDLLSAMGIHNVVVMNLAPSGVLFGCDPDEPAFLSEPWWHIFGQVCDHAASIGTFIWFYDQIGFSGANYQADLVAQHPQFCAERLKSTSVEGVGDLTINCPGGATPMAAYVVPLDAPDEVRYAPLEKERVRVVADRPSRLRLIYTIRQGYDFFSREACEALLDTVHRQFHSRLPQHLGRTIVGSFQDELPDLPTWSIAFGESFASTFGYRIESVIHRLFEEGNDDSRRTRLDYHAHRAKLAKAEFFKPFFQWH